ncbi:MAG: histidine kinase [Microbacterium sp. SCN 71-17]|uniref:sensor histidine kinase n=1 Tax=Microbacterium sp. SCN 71-17 TaxID=1660111 RepID=UPI00086CDAAC|nr:histidine kinase [Microbacterium sp. SCN 71-17]ODT38098.1 MAG: histidine kinase [Microbacterium sp. SCN 71-17]
MRIALRPLFRYQLVVDLVAAGLFGLLSFLIELDPGNVLGNVGALVVVALFSAALALRRLQPGAALLLAWIAAIVQMSLQRDPSPVDLVTYAVLYTAAAYGTRRVYWAGFASTVVGAVVVTAYLTVRAGRDVFVPTFDTLAIVLVAGFAFLLSWGSGTLARTTRRAAANAAARRAAEEATIAEQERVRIARDMHDVVAHSLAVVIAQADGARYAAAQDSEAATRALSTISTTARAALGDVRLLLQQLRHSQADGPQPTLADLESLYAQVRAAGVDLQTTVDPAPAAEPPTAIQLAVYRILQEALTNALRHGGDRRVAVRFAWHPDRVDPFARRRSPFRSRPAAWLAVAPC